ncbi:MAG: TraB/GumN family protein, partial [Acidobacteriota bacterium]
GGRRIVLVGTAHVSQASVDLVHRVIEQEHPDRVCVELDAQRYEALSRQTQWENLDLKQVIRKRQLSTLIVNLLLASYQKKLGAELGVQPGMELLEATRVAEALGVPVELCDRDVRITLRRAVAATPLWRRIMLLSELVMTMFEGTEVTEDQLEELRQQDVLNELMAELGKAHPDLKRVLIDERDTYLAQRIMDSEGQTLVAVVGAGHLQGIEESLRAHQTADLTPLEVIPPPSPMWKILGWGIPILILGAIGWIAWQQGSSQAWDSALFWTLANGIPASIGAMLAFAHPLAILTAFVAAPLTSLTPVIGAAHVVAFVQAYLVPPKVRELKSVADDFGQPVMWWKNRLLRIFLAYILPGLGSMIGSVVGGGKILTDLFGGAPPG